MVVPSLSKNRGSYLDNGPSQEQIERRNIIKHKLCLGLDDGDADEPDYLAQISSTPSPARTRRFRSMSPGNLNKRRTSPARTPLRRSKSNDLDSLVVPAATNSARSSRTTGNNSARSSRTTGNNSARSSRTTGNNSAKNAPRRNYSLGAAPKPKRSSSFGSFSGFSIGKRNQDAPSLSNSGHSRRQSEYGTSASKDIVCLGKSWNKLSLEDAEEDDDICSDEENDIEMPARRTRQPSATARIASPRRSKSLGSNFKASFSLGSGNKKFSSLLKSKKDNQVQQQPQQEDILKTPSTSSRRMRGLRRSHSGDEHDLRLFAAPSRTSSWDGSTLGAERSPSFRERRNGLVPGAPFSRSPSVRGKRPSFPSLDKEASETDDTVSMDSSSFNGRPSSASSREEIFQNAVRRAAERQVLKHQSFEETKSPSKSGRTSLLRSIHAARLRSPSFSNGHVEQNAHPAPAPRPSLQSTSTWSSDQDDDIDSDDESSQGDTPAGPGIFERGLKALEQIYDDLNA